MKGLTHIFVGIGFVGLILSLLKVTFFLWLLGTLFIAPLFSRLPDQDQKISRITFNQILPHRGKGTHNLLYGLPLLTLGILKSIPLIGSLLVFFIASIFGALFIHTVVDAFNHGGVWVGIFKINGFLRWDSFWGNLSFKLFGIVLFLIALFNYF